MSNVKFTALVEEDYSSHNFSVYIPELRLSAIGDTLDEALTNAKEAIEMTLAGTAGKQMKLYRSQVLMIRSIENPFIEEVSTSA
ncbi:type II toxin-antitoxin system HicB family antitoxin [Paenibacillus alkaliterrae]|uniref:type II toxin-antitoxin system HicB family antitoxin n=1 Tax=Paenibacillus alkaliterrae TaxID=320909 RepID=UPI001F300E23|nr:type II toxin-antitoxin system HicB family antitoxin [Paenibacillus alkaliterrae]MCF2940613.1 type II toxin-antitoxin system HicB family antitoxin [Paenibacillus alkaliterrae]